MKLAYGVFLAIHHSTLSIMQGAIWLFVHNVGGCVGAIANRGACVAAYVCAHTLSAVSALWV